MTSEEWKTIPDTDGLYEASSLGRIRSNSRVVIVRCKCGEVKRTMRIKGRVLKPWIDVGRYEVLRLCVGGEQKQSSVHRLVALAFHGDGGDLIVNHIDGIKGNNRPENLEWVTYSENMVHALETGLRTDTRPMIATPKNGGEEVRFPSISAAMRAMGADRTANIIAAAKGKIPSAYGYRWKYEDELEAA
jgi:hypothetical protein